MESTDSFPGWMPGPAVPDWLRFLDLAAFASRSRRLGGAIATGDAPTVARSAQLPDVMIPSIAFLLEVYRHRTRKVTGASAFLHPLRVAMILRRQPETTRDELVAAGLFHDYVEDTQEAVGPAFFAGLGLPRAEDVARWVDAVTRRGEESYVTHVGRACRDDASVMIKGADIIDNLLDLRAEPENPEDEADLEGALAEAQHGQVLRVDHPPTPRIRGEARLYAVWKCFSVINLARREGRSPFPGEEICRRAGLRECRRIAIHLLRYHLDGALRDRVLEEHRIYCRSSGVCEITPPDPTGTGPDGLSLLMARRSEGKASLNSLYADKRAMLRSTLALHEVFCRFANPTFWVRGLEALERV